MAWTDTAKTLPTNPTFASGLAGWTETNTTGDWTPDATTGHDDSTCAKLTAADLGGAGWQCNTYITGPATTLLVSKKQTLVCYYKILTGAQVGGGRLSVTLRAIDGTSSVTLASTVWTTLTVDVWTQLTVTFTPTSGTVKPRLLAVSGGAGVATQYPLLIDNFYFYEAGPDWTPADAPAAPEWTVS